MTATINQNQQTTPSRALLLENRKVCALKPTSQYTCCLIVLIQRIFFAVLNWLYPFQRTPYVAIVSALDPHRSHLPNLNRDYLCAYFRRFVEGETTSSPNLKLCVDSLQEQYQMINTYQKSDLGGIPAKKRTKFSTQLNGWITKAQKLKEGEQSLFVASSTQDDELFYLFSRKEGHTHLKIIGRGTTVGELTQKKDNELIASVDFGAVDAIAIEQLLRQCSTLSCDCKCSETLQKNLAALITDHNLTVKNTSQVQAKRQATVDLFFTVFQQIEKNSDKTATHCARLELRAEIFTLFGLLKDIQQRFSVVPYEMHALEHMLRLCSQNLHQAFEAKHISKEECADLVAELAVVQKRIDAEKQRKKPSLGRPSMPSMDTYSLKSLNLRTPTSQAPVSRPSVSLNAAPLPTPTFNTTKSLLRARPNAQPQVPLLTQLKGLVDKEFSLPQLINTIYCISWDPQEPGRTANGKECIEHLSTLSKRLVETCLREQSLHLDAYEAFIKMGQMLAQLTEVQDATPDKGTRRLIRWLKNGAGLLDHGWYEKPMDRGGYEKPGASSFSKQLRSQMPRVGYALHPGNARTALERGQFGKKGANPAPSRIEGGDPKKRAHLEMQVQLFHHLSKFGYPIIHGFSPTYPLKKETPALLPCIHQWSAPLPTSLLAAYMGSDVMVYGNDGRKPPDYNRRYRLETDYAGQLSPEYIQHDPKGALEAAKTHYLQGGLKTWRKVWEGNFTSISAFDSLTSDRVLMQMTEKRITRLKKQHDRLRTLVHIFTLGKEKIFENDKNFPFAEDVLKQSPFTESVIDEQYQAALRNQKTYLQQCAKLEKEIELSNEERTALLSLLRGREPQREVLPFIQTHPALCAHPAIQAYIELIFFHPSLLDFLQEKKNGVFCELMPNFLAEKITFYLRKNEKQPADLSVLLFLIRTSERLKGIYKELGLDTTSFMPMYNAELQTYVQAARRQRLAPLDQYTLISCRLKTLFEKKRLTQEEICQVILDMQLLQKAAEGCAPTAQIGWELSALQKAYQSVIEELKSQPLLEPKQLDFLMDSLCSQVGCAVQPASWTGEWPLLTNGFYRIDLTTLDIEDLRSAVMVVTLPSSIAHSLAFTHAFPDLRHELISATLQKLADGTHVYTFEDGQKRPCCIENKGGALTLYRSFPQSGKPQLFQAVTLVDPPPHEEASDDVAPESLPKRHKHPPSLLYGTAFIDPKSLMGYTLSSDGEPELEVHLKRTLYGKRIHHVIDLREAGSKPMQLTTLDEVSNSTLKQLEQIEDPAHIRVWGTGNVEKIELPRFGLQFTMQNGHLTCTDPRYAGYRIRFGASLRERRGITHSLLLEHADRSRPKKLLFPSASIFSTERYQKIPYQGLALAIRFLQLVCSRTNPNEEGQHYIYERERIDTTSASIPYACVDLRVHTEELAYSRTKKIEEQQELLLHACLEDNIPLALEVIDSIEIDNDEKQIKKWLDFLSSTLDPGQDARKAALATKIIEKLYMRARGQTAYEKVIKNKLAKGTIWMALCMKHWDTLPDTLKPAQIFLMFVDSVPEDKKVLLNMILEQPPTNRSFYLALMPTAEQSMLEKFLPGWDTLPSAAKQKLLSSFDLPKEVDERVLDTPLAKDDLSRKIHLTAKSPLLFERATLNGQSLQELRKTVTDKRKTVEKDKENAKDALDTLLQTPSHPAEQLAVWGLDKQLPTFGELCLALLQDDFVSLTDKLPKDIDLNKLKSALIHYFDAEVKLNLLLRSEEDLTKKTAVSDTLLNQLAYEREYDPHVHPELLAFEAFHFVTFRNGATSQLHLLKELLSAQSSIVQAGTGSGKSAVLSVLRGLMRANGANLVTQKVLPHLYQETLTILTQRLGGVFKRKIYPLLFTPSMPTQDGAGNPLFKTIYSNLLETIKNKGCVLTDYKSFPFLEEKLIALSKIIEGDLDDKRQTPRNTLENWFYLVKILKLLKERNDELMDEFDQPLSATQQVQTQIKENQGYAEWKLEIAFELFDFLRKDQPLRLEQNLQGDIPDHLREESITRLARHMAQKMAQGEATEELLFAYLTGQNQDVLTKLGGWTLLKKDQLAFVKEEIVTYLPHTLNRSGRSNYGRSKEGDKVVIHSKGNPRTAKFGNPTEEINFLIQDYLQQKIAYPTLRSYLTMAKRDYTADPIAAQERLAEVLPDVSLKALASLSPDAFDEQVEAILEKANKNTDSVFYFLKKHLRELKKSGIVVPMDPQASVAMSFAVSGVSATTGSLGSLHQQFERDEEIAKNIQEQQLKRLSTRSYGKPTTYDPVEPLKVFDTLKDIPELCAIIDASGAFRSVPPEDVARALLKKNKNLERVDYYDKDGAVASIGNKEAPLSKRGFYFPEAQTRGSDQVLRPDGVALLLTRKKGDIEDFIQEEGRMRHTDQRVLVALPDFNRVDTLKELIDHKLSNQREAHAQDRYRAEIQRMRQFVRAAARDVLLETDLSDVKALFDRETISVDDVKDAFALFLDALATFEPLFIQQPEKEGAPGAYFEKYKDLVKAEYDPVVQLNAYKTKLIAAWGDTDPELDLSELDAYTPPESTTLPATVLPVAIAEGQQQEVELELQQEQEMETEQQSELDKGKVDNYPTREPYDYGDFTSADDVHRAFSPKIDFERNFLPLYRQDPLHKRAAWDDRTGPIGSVEVVYHHASGEIEHIHVGDLLDEIDRESPTVGRQFRYDIRLNRVTHGELGNVDRGELAKLIAQVKFYDGQCDNYSKDECAHLRRWLQRHNDGDAMLTLLQKTILKYKPDRFKHSQLDHLFKELRQAAV